MKLHALLLASLCFAATSIAETAKNLAIDPKPRDGGWIKRHESFNVISKKGEAQLVFLGDSITQGWEGNGKEVWAKTWAPLKAANCGVFVLCARHVVCLCVWICVRVCARAFHAIMIRNSDWGFHAGPHDADAQHWTAQTHRGTGSGGWWHTAWGK